MLADDLRGHLAQITAADARLLQPGSPFEVTQERVFGEQMTVFASRRKSIGELLDASLANGANEFLVFEHGRRLTFAETFQLVDAVGAGLAGRYGIRKGDHVAICAANSLGWVLVALACARLGAVVVALNSWWTTEELVAALDLTGPKLIVADRRRRETLAGHAGDRPILAAEDVADDLAAAGGVGPAPVDIPPVEVAEDDPWVLAFTSGTSGAPKAAVLSHRSFLGFAQLNAFIGARSMVLSGNFQPPSRPVVRLAVFPLFHISGLGSLVAALAFGHKTVWPAGRFDAGQVIELTDKEGITMWGGASTHLARLLDHPALDTVDPQQLIQVGIGGSASTPSLIAHTESRLPHLKGTFSSGYGMTECGGLATYASNALLRSAADCVGPALPTVEVKITDVDGGTVRDGELGTICVRSPILMIEYWRNPEANVASILPDRWLRTEDFGRMVDGLLFVASRHRDLIIRGGENVYPIEIENCLDGHGEVLESAVYGVTDAEFGQTVHAAVVVTEGSTVTVADLVRRCAEKLAYFKVPTTVQLRTTPLPRNASGKILKQLIAEGTEHLAPTEAE